MGSCGTPCGLRRRNVRTGRSCAKRPRIVRVRYAEGKLADLRLRGAPQVPGRFVSAAGYNGGMLRFDDLALRRGPLLLLEHANLALHAGWRVGISGRNGAGKSSLLALVAGELAPDAGHFERPRDWTLAFVRQEVPALETSALDYALDGDIEYRHIERQLVDAEEKHDGVRIASLHERLH